MENITECIDLEFKLEYWISNIAICSFVSLVSLYILLALVYHKIRLKKPHPKGFLQLPIEERYRILSKCICISIAIAPLILFLSSVSYWAVEGITIFSGSNLTAAETVCDVSLRITNAAITGGNGFVYLFLWLRQRVFYVHPSLEIFNNKYVSIFSFAVLILWILFWISLAIPYFMKVQYRLISRIGCIVDKGSFKLYSKVVLAWTAVSILMQMSLLSLFVYPILKQAQWRDQQISPNLMRRSRRQLPLHQSALELILQQL